MSEKAERKELKQPDEFQVVAGQAMTWMLEKKNLVLGVVAAVLVIAIGLKGVSVYSESRETKAGGLLAEALEIAARPLAADPGVQPGRETFATKEARDQALTAALEHVRAEVPTSNAARTATAQLGFQKLKSGDAAAAVTLLSGYADTAPADDALTGSVLQSLGAAQEKLGKFDDAKATYQKLAKVSEAQGAYEQARLLLVQKKPEAKEALEKVAKDFPKDPVAMEAQRRLELAALPPPPPPGSVPAPEAVPATPAPAPVKAKGKAPAKAAAPAKAKATGAKAPAKKG